jgi:hypothetical protein
MSEIYPTLVNVLPSDTFEQWRIKTNSVMAHAEAGAVNLGNVNFLTTDAKTNAVDAINEVNSHSDANAALIGNLDNLKVEIKKSDLVTSINEHFDYQISNTNTQVTTERTAREAADVTLTQSLSALTTRVGINEGELATTQVGAGLSSSGTYVQNNNAFYISDAVSLNDADNKIDSKLSLLDDRDSVHDQKIVDLQVDVATKALSIEMGNLSSLHTNITNKTSIVAAINTLYDMLAPLYNGTSDKYVKIGGDTMTGTLTIQNGNLDVSGTTSSRIYCDGDIVAYRNS